MSRRLLVLGLATLALGACGDAARDDAAAADSAAAPAATVPTGDVERAVAIHRAIAAQPDSAAAVLERFQLTETVFDSLMYRIAADSAMAAEYSEAIR